MPSVKLDSKSVTASETSGVEDISIQNEGEFDSLYVADELEMKRVSSEEHLKLQGALCAKINGLIEDYLKLQKGDPLKANLQNVILADVVDLRRLNRIAQFRNKSIKDKTSAERQRIDEQYLQLQNLLYEVLHLQKEVTRCLEFKSAHEEINLVPIEQFYKEAPVEISKPDLTRNDPHQLRLARLTWELEERKILDQKLKDLESEFESVNGDIEIKQELLDSLQPKLSAIVEASRPLQDAVGVDYEKASYQRECRQYLPAPLFVIFQQASSYQEVFDKRLQVSIEGDLESVKEKLSSGRSTPENQMSGESDTEDMPAPLAEGSRRASGRSQMRKSVSELIEENKASLLDSFPLFVTLKFVCKDNGKVSLHFHFLKNLGIVTVKCTLELSTSIPLAVASAKDLLTQEMLLCNLFHDKDDGSKCPNYTGCQKLQHHNIDFASVTQHTGGAFGWAQKLAGLDFDSHHQPNSSLTTPNFGVAFEGCSHLQKILRLVKNRLSTRLALHDQLSSLESLNMSMIPKDCVALLSRKILGRLTSWKSITFDDFKAHPATQAVVEAGLVDDSGWCFQLTIERTDSAEASAKLVAIVHVPIDYPHDEVLFATGLNWQRGFFDSKSSELIRDMERNLNLEFPTLIPEAARQYVLYCQVIQLAAMLDIILEVESGRMGSQYFSREHLIARKSRGRNHEVPTTYNPDGNYFTFPH